MPNYILGKKAYRHSPESYGKLKSLQNILSETGRSTDISNILKSIEPKNGRQMTYEEFKKELYRDVQETETAQGRTVRLLEQHMVSSDPVAAHMINMINRKSYGRDTMLIREDMLCILWSLDKEEQFRHWPVRSLYERYRLEGWQAVLPQIRSALTDTGEEEILWPGENLRYVACRNHIIVRSMNFDRHRGELDSAVYRKIGDIALVLYLLPCEKQTDHLAVPLTRNVILPWKIAGEKLLKEAMVNTCRKMPPRFFLGSDRRKFFPYDQGVLLPEEEGRQTGIEPRNRREGRNGYLLTTTARVDGAIAFFYPGVRDVLAQKLDSDYYVVFPSVHEAIIHPVNCIHVREIRASVQHINAIYGESGMLSDRVFCYHKNRRLLQLL